MALANSGVFLNRCSIHFSVGSIGRWNSHDVRPSAKKFLQRLTVRAGRLVSRSVAAVSLVMSTSNTWIAVQRAVGERVGLVLRLLQVLLVELLLVDDQDAVRPQIADVDLQRRRVHRHEHVEVVARREDLAAGEVQLEAGDAGERARGGADLGGEVGQGAEIVAGQRGLVGELHAGDLHAVAGVAGEADDDGISFLSSVSPPLRRRAH